MVTRRTVLQKVRGCTLKRASTACRHRVSGSLSLPSRGSFHLSFTVLCAIGHWVVFSLRGWSPFLPTRFHVSRGTLDTASYNSDFVYETFTLFGLTSQTVLLSYCSHVAVQTPECTHSGLGSFPFARRYSGNRFFFLFLRLLRCFSSAGSLHIPMYSVYDDWGLLSRVSPFRNQRVIGYLLLTAAYRSLSRLSSALSAKASTLRPFLLNLPSYRSVKKYDVVSFT